MSEANPDKALSALLPPSIPIEGTEEEVRPFTLGLFAVLDRIGSPLLGGSGATDALALLPSLYAICRGARAALESRNLLLDAAAWADALPPPALAAIKAAAARQIAVFIDAAPTPKKEEASAPATTAG